MITKKIVDCINAVFFLLFIICAFLFTFLRGNETYSYYENRNLASMPTMTSAGMLDGTDFSAVETYLSDHAPGRNTALKIRTWTDLYLLRRPVVNDTVILRDEHILLPYTKHEYDADTLNPAWIEQGAERISETLAGHAELTRSYGGYFCYIAVPCQYVCYEDAYPTYLNNRHTYTERSSEALFTCLEKKNVPYIDLREIYKSSGTLREYSSTIDNHYSIQGAFEAYRVLLETINRDTLLNLTVPSNEDFTLSQIENPYLGSRIRKLCGLWESGEHLWKMTPNEPLPYIRSIKGEPADGEVYALPNNDRQEVLYTAYMGGDLSESRIDTGRDELPDILIYGDSFTNALECVLWYSFDTMYSYDFRYYTGHTLDELIRKYQPDVVVCVRDYQQLLLETGNGK